MEITQTIELTDSERLTVAKFLGLVDKISDIAGCSMEDVFHYFGNDADIVGEYQYNVKPLHQISEIKGC